MKSSFRLITLIALTLISISAFAQTTPEASVLPVTEPLDVGGTILQPGNYTIRVVPSFTDRNKIQILSADGQKVFATVLTVPHQLEPGEEVPNTTFVYFPAGENSPRALRTWFAADPPGQHGHDIVYEESRAKQLARIANSRVIYYPEDAMEADFEKSTLAIVTPEATVETYTYVAPKPVVTETRTTVTEAPAMTSQSTDVEMPATASDVPLMALLGLLSVGGAIALRVSRPE